jgi:selenocysteine lyase/cysteine desulfurase
MTTFELTPDPTLAAFQLPPGLIYLNSAGQTPRLRSVIAAGTQALALGAQPWCSSMRAWLARPQRVRALAARVFGCRQEQLALVTSVAYGMATAAANLPLRSGQTVLTLAGEHASGIYAWATAAAAAGARWRQIERGDGDSWTESLLDAIGPDVAVVVTPACHWLDGRRVDLPRVAAAAQRVGAALVIDATQALGVQDLDLSALDPDFLVAAGHKWLLGAPGLGYLYVAERHHDRRPLEEHAWSRQGGLIATAGAHEPPPRVSGAARFDASSVYAGLPLAAAEPAFEALLLWGRTHIHAQLQVWQQSLLAELRSRGMDDWIAAADCPQLTALSPPGANDTDCQQLSDELAAAGIMVAARGAAIRVSPYLHNHGADATALVEALANWQRRRLKG